MTNAQTSEFNIDEMVRNAVWFAVFSVVILAAVLVVAACMRFYRHEKYMLAVENKHKGERCSYSRKLPVTHHVINPFQIILIGFFVASVVMFMPYCYYFNDFGAGNWGKAFMASLHGTLRTFVLDGEYDAVAGFTSVLTQSNSTVGWFYTVWSWLIYVLAPVFATGVILTLFKSALAYVGYRIKPFVSDVYLMSELNEKSLALAEDIVIRDRKARGRLARIFSRRVIVFADVFEKNEEENYELVARAKSLGAICVKRDVTEISLRLANRLILRRPRDRKIYLIAENEEENVDQGLKMIEHCEKKRGYNNEHTEIYIFSCGAASATLIDTAIKSCDMKVRRVDDNYNLILEFLWNNSVFELADATSSGTGEKRAKTLHAVIVGLGGYGMDILRTLCWFLQMPGYRLVVDVFDGENGTEKVKHAAPELFDMNRCVKDGEPYYSIEFHDNVLYGSAQFDIELGALKGVSVVFCTLGGDEENIACSMDIRTLLGRTKAYEECRPPIYSVVYAPQLSRRLTVRDRDGEKDYGIRFIGRIYDRFTVDVIEQAALDAYGRAINIEYAINSSVWDHIVAKGDAAIDRDVVDIVSKMDGEILDLFRAADGTGALDTDEKVTAIQNKYSAALDACADKKFANDIKIVLEKNISGYKYEYNRRSSKARALAVRWLVPMYYGENGAPYNAAIREALDVEPGGDADALIDVALAKNEHNRWSAYTRSMGYVLGERDEICKTRKTLVPFDELPEGNKLKDRPIGALSRYIAKKTTINTEDK